MTVNVDSSSVGFEKLSPQADVEQYLRGPNSEPSSKSHVDVTVQFS